MKKLFLLGLTVILFVACKQTEQRYFAESNEINTSKAGITAFENGDWEAWRSHFADTAKVYANSSRAVTIEARLESLKGLTSNFKSYGFDHEDEHVEMVLDKEDETWVYYWADFNYTANNGKELSVPVHLAFHFDGGKIVAEHIYFDATELNSVMVEMASAAKIEEESMEAESKEGE